MQKPEPIVSVIIPMYNHQAFILKTLESVWAQTFTRYEIIIINDGSPDNTDAVLQPFIKQGRIDRYIVQRNAGQGAARNRGIEVAQGKYIALLDDDDYYPPDKLSWQVECMNDFPNTGVVYGFPQPVNASGEAVQPRDAYNDLSEWPWQAPSGNIYKELTQRPRIVSPGQTLIRREALEITAFDPGIRGCDDWDLWIRIAEKWNFRFEKRVALFYRLHDTNASRDTLTMRKNDFRLLQKHMKRNLLFPNRLSLWLYRYLAFVRWTPVMMIQQAEKDMEMGKSGEALDKLKFAAEFRPYLWFEPRFRTLWQSASLATKQN